jgi:septal ring factor EnvC (AmiA/AmiB activator)
MSDKKRKSTGEGSEKKKKTKTTKSVESVESALMKIDKEIIETKSKLEIKKLEVEQFKSKIKQLESQKCVVRKCKREKGDDGEMTCPVHGKKKRN